LRESLGRRLLRRKLGQELQMEQNRYGVPGTLGRNHGIKELVVYADYVTKLAKRFHEALDSIEAEHGFEYGPEFEVALCRVLFDALPDRFGVARGYAVNPRGDSAGDDILIYERIRFPTFRGLPVTDYASKERIPIEAIYCYIEAKHTLHIDGDDGQSLKKAIEQVKAVRTLCRGRKAVPLTDSGSGVNFSQGFTVTAPEGYPDYRNPCFTAIIARYVKPARGKGALSTTEEIQEAISRRKHFVDARDEDLPDIMVLGDSVVALPVIQISEHEKLLRPFLVPGRSSYHVCDVNKIAFGVGFCALMAALDWIQLGAMPWSSIVGEAGGLPRHLE
jgi:hypothetical protein